MFISARVDRWSAAARLLIGASPPVSHTHIDSLSSLLVQQPSCTSRPLPPPPFSILFSSFSLPLSRRPSCFYSPSVSSSSSISSSPLASLSFHHYFRPLGLSAAVCLPIIPPSPAVRRPCHRPSFFSMSTNNSLPFYPYFLFRFSPAYSRTAESPLFPSHVYALSSFPTRLPNSDAFFLPFPRGVYQSRGLQADRALSLPSSLLPSPVRARSRFFPMHGFFPSLLLSIERCVAIRTGRLSAAPRR